MDEPPPTKKPRVINGVNFDSKPEHEHIKIKIVNVADHHVVLPQFLNNSNHHQICEIPTDEEVYDNDLPLISNVDDVHVPNYILLFDLSIESQTVNGTAVVFLEKLGENVTEITLDCCTVQVSRIEVISGTIDTDLKNAHDLLVGEGHVIEEVKFELGKWSLKIFGWTGEFPKAVRIHYKALPSSPSIHWRPVRGFKIDPDNVPLCCYTPAAPVNNRGLFPCQEPPTAMATWQCFVKVRKPYEVFLSSDKPGMLFSEDDLTTTSYFNCSEKLPMSTFAIFVTTLNSGGILQDEAKSAEVDIPVRVIFQDDQWKTMASILLNFVFNLLGQTDRILGKLPFDRLDVTRTQTFPTLGLANPNMIFLSPSLLTGQTPLLLCRTAHELAHFWFGLSIGALDWTEEWLSEGFATFMEDIFLRETLHHDDNLNLNPVIVEDITLRPCVRLLTLQHELENVPEAEADLHRLVQDNESKNRTAVKDGLDPMKQVLQVHYLKGYFFLKSLSDLVGEQRFLIFLHDYVHHFKGTLLTSDEFVSYFKHKFCPEFISSKIDLITTNWLRQVNLPPTHSTVNLSIPTLILSDAIQNLFPQCTESLSKVNSLTLYFLNAPPTEHLSFLRLNSTEKLIFMEQILNLPTLTDWQLQQLELIIKPDLENPEVIHRWCEIIIKFRSRSHIHTVKKFLLNHPAMGVYLYGELMISEKLRFQKLARKLYRKRRKILDPPLLQILKRMIF